MYNDYVVVLKLFQTAIKHYVDDSIKTIILLIISEK
jgi:hypothetical protein